MLEGSFADKKFCQGKSNIKKFIALNQIQVTGILPGMFFKLI